MRKVITGILCLSMVFALGISVSAAPTISGEVEIGVVEGRTDKLETGIDFQGKLAPQFQYDLRLESDTDDYIDNSVNIGEASLTYINDLGQVKFGKFAYNPSVMDMMDEENLREMNGNSIVKLSTEFGETGISAAVGYQISAGNGFDEGAYQAEVDYKFLDNYKIGLNYQDLNDGSDAGVVFQIEAQPLEFLKLYGEIGNATGTDDNRTLLGVLATYEQLSACGEYNTDSDEWAAKIGYQVTDNLKAEYQHNSDSDNEARVSYIF